MKPQEAIEILKKNKPTYDTRECGKELCTAVDKAIEALKKQIPKKPIPIITDDNEFVCVICPTCQEIKVDCNYCANCGQAIDWSE